MQYDYSVLYVGKHFSGGNDDEGAIADALQKSGCRVTRINESNLDLLNREIRKQTPYDLCLFHKWNDDRRMELINAKKVFWYFDLVGNPDQDPELHKRSRNRLAWMDRVVPKVDLGFCTDGDFVLDSKTSRPLYRHKLFWLSQGFDQRLSPTVLYPGPYHERGTDLLFTGSIRGGGQGRRAFHEHLLERTTSWGKTLVSVENGTYGEELTHLIWTTQVYICPPTPTTDYYWSNRIYNAAGRGALIVHKDCKWLRDQYFSEREVLYYSSLEMMDYQIRRALSLPRHEADRIRIACLEKTRQHHTYFARIQTVLDTCQHHLSLPPGKKESDGQTPG